MKHSLQEFWDTICEKYQQISLTDDLKFESEQYPNQMQTNIIEFYSSDIDIESIDENLEFVILIIEHYTWKESNNFKN